MQVEAGESKLLLLETFSFFFFSSFFSHERVLEELGLLKIGDHEDMGTFKHTYMYKHKHISIYAFIADIFAK